MLFGEFFKIKRTIRNISLKNAAEILNISPSYLSSIENGSRTAPPFLTQQRMADILELNEGERYQLYDLAAESKHPLTLADDINEYIYKNPVIREMLRYSMKCQLTEKEWETIFVYTKRNYHY